jgi:hypothetical protein
MYCFQLNVSRELKAKLEHARDLMSHANPTGDLAVVVERALDLLLHQLKSRRFGQTGKRKASHLGQTGGLDADVVSQTGKREADVVSRTGKLDADALSQARELEADALSRTLRARALACSGAAGGGA